MFPFHLLEDFVDGVKSIKGVAWARMRIDASFGSIPAARVT